jgi:hypothetical protein
LRGQGVFITGDANGREVVRETITCAHCNKIAPKPLPDEPYGFCTKCYQPTCLKCGGSERCAPFEAKLARYEAKMRLRAAV